MTVLKPAEVSRAYNNFCHELQIRFNFPQPAPQEELVQSLMNLPLLNVPPTSPLALALSANHLSLCIFDGYYVLDVVVYLGTEPRLKDITRSVALLVSR